MTTSSGLSRLALAALAAAVLGAGLLAAILAGAGALGGGTATTVVRSVAVGVTAGDETATTAAAPASGAALYAVAARGVVDVTVRSASTGAQGLEPFTPPEGAETMALGSGSVIDARGHILTAQHVVDGATSITVKLQDGTLRKATVLGTDEATDVAVLQISTDGLTLHPLTLGSLASLRVGSPLAVIGNAFGYSGSLTTGVVSGLDRTIEAPNGFTVAHAIQTDAAMNPGNSGGPVLDARGHIVGIADQIATSGVGDESNTGVGFAVPIDIVRAALPQLLAGRKVEHAYLGIATTDEADTTGAVVSTVTGSSPAGHAGLRSGDVIVGVDAGRTQTSGDVVAAVAAHRPGDRLRLQVRRDSRTLTIDVTLGTQPLQAAVVPRG